MSKAASDPSSYQLSEQVGHLLRRAYQRHVAIFQRIVPDSQLTAAQFVVLCAIRDHGRCDIHDVVRAIAIDEATVRGIVERLKWRELLTAKHEPGDTRQMELALTPAGDKLVAETVPHARAITDATFGDLNATERADLVRLLRRISGIDEPAA
ncbi:MAG: MarR family winged helix-turn-helix transcriptional regulator [Lautropia sp.]